MYLGRRGARITLPHLPVQSDILGEILWGQCIHSSASQLPQKFQLQKVTLLSNFLAEYAVGIRGTIIQQTRTSINFG